MEKKTETENEKEIREQETIKEKETEQRPKENQKIEEKVKQKPTISYSDFMKLDLRTAKIIEVNDIKGKDKLYKLTIEVGNEKRTLLAGLKEFYSKEELTGKTIIIVANLEPKKMAGILSEGMLLAAEQGEKIALLTLDKELLSGTEIH